MISHPASRRNTSAAAGASGSATRIFILFRWPVRLCQRSFFRESYFGIDVLNRRHARAKADRESLCRKDDFEFRDHCKEIVEIEIAEMCKPEDLPLHTSLPVRDDGIETIPEFFDDDPG